jgi:hypothetical protein
MHVTKVDDPKNVNIKDIIANRITRPE